MKLFFTLLVLLPALFDSTMTFSPITQPPPPPTPMPTTIPHTQPPPTTTPRPPTTTPPPTTEPPTPPPPTTERPTTPPTTMPPRNPWDPTPMPYHKSDYVIMAPIVIRPNMYYRVSVNIRKGRRITRVRASIKKNPGNTVIVTKMASFRGGKQGRLTLRLPAEMDNGQYTLYVEGRRGFSFTHTGYLQFKPKRLSLYVQTDKGIYKPGDKVHMRAFGLFPSLKVYDGALDLYIKDANGNTIQRWLNQSSEYGVVGKEFRLSTRPVLGDWSVECKTERESVAKKFKVAKYVLPKFETTVKMPSYLLSSAKDVAFSVKAKYTFGKPVSGFVDIYVKMMYTYQTYDKTPHIQPFLHLNMPIDGEVDVTIAMSKLKAARYYADSHRKFAVYAVVTDEQTGNTMKAMGEVKIFRYDTVLEFPKMNPKNFKPGLEYTAYLKVTQPDGLPIGLNDEKVVITTTLQFKETPKYPPHDEIMPYHYYPGPSYRSKVLPSVTLAVPENGLVIFPVHSEIGAAKIRVTATYKGAQTRYLNMEQTHSPTNTYLQVLLVTKVAINAGDDIDLELKSTQPMTKVNYQILARGELVYSGFVDAMGGTNHTFSLRAISHMAPTAKIVMYYVTANGEVVIDSISFEVSGAFRNKMVMELSDERRQPGEDIRVHIRADPGSLAYLLAIDQSVLLLASGNDVTSKDVYDELDKFDYNFAGHLNPRPFPMPMMRVRPLDDRIANEVIREDFLRFPYPIYIGGTDAKTILKNAGIITFTNALVYRYQPPQYGPMATAMPMVMENRVEATQDIAAPAPGQQQDSSVRSNFPETWLWTEVKTCANGEASVVATVPDTITSWIASGFAVHAVSGFGMPDSPSSLRVFKPFFISLNLPYSVILGEEVAIQVIIFNYMDSDQNVRVSLEPSVAFESVYVDCNGVEYKVQKEQVFTVLVKKGDIVSVFFPIVALKLGYINIEVRAWSSMASDGVRRQLLIEAPGITHEYNIPVIVDLMGKSRQFKKTVEIKLPHGTVHGSEHVKITAIGDLMGPSIDGLDKLLRIPMGCGEQTMISLAPDVAIVEYLKTTNQLTGSIKDKAISFMEKGYQNELTYRHSDGSYSAFTRDPSGSMWLTAFVARVFHQASNHIYIDPNVIRTAVQWIIQRQKPDGSYPEPGRVIHKNMQGKAASGVGLSAFVFISLLENKDIFEPSSTWYNRMQAAQAKTLKYLEDHVSETEDLYLMCLSVYAFQLAGSTETDELLTRLVERANTTDGLIHWNYVETKKASTGSWHRPNPTNAINTEMTSYVLKTYAVRKDLSSGRRVIQWVTTQRNSNGGFSSTQDTVVALEAMSMFADLVFSDAFDIEAHCILDQGETYKFVINHENALISQRREPLGLPNEVVIDATGRGLAIIDIAVSFNVETEIDDTSFALNVTITNETKNHMILETCASWLGEGEESGMAIQEIGIPSGFVPDTESLTELPILKKSELETEKRKFTLYFDVITKKPVCISLKLDRVGLVANVKPSPIKVTDYYQPTNQVTVFYMSKLLENSKICDICPNCHNCNAKSLGGKKVPAALNEEELIEKEMNGI